MLAIANALEGMSRAEAARAAGIERQSLRDAVVRFNAAGLAGLIDRPSGGRPERLSYGEQAVLVAYVLRGPDPDRGTLQQAHVPASHVARGAPSGAVAAEGSTGSS